MVALPLVASAQLLIKPNVIVYPFTANGATVDREASSRLATVIAQQMADTKLVTVLPPPPGTERKDYQRVARANNADFYVSGFISPLGDGVSVVEQVVSASTGIIAYGSSAQLQTYSDAAGQGQQLAGIIAQLANRALAAVPPPPQTAASPTPQPSEAAQASLSKLFGRRRPAASAAPKPAASKPAAPKATVPKPVATQAAAAAATMVPVAQARNVTPTPAAVSVAAAPGAARYALLPVEGSAPEALRSLAQQRLATASHAENAADASAACRDNANSTVLRAALSERADPAFATDLATVDLSATSCAGKTLWHKSFDRSAGNAQLAVQLAADAAIGAYLHPPPPRKR